MNYISPTLDPTLPTIEKRSGVEHRELLNEYVIPHKPVVITDAIKNWPALGKWTPEFFAKNFPNAATEVHGRMISLKDQVEYMLRSTPENPAPYSYSLNIAREFPELLRDLKPQLVFGRSDRALHPLMPRLLMAGTEIHEIFFGGNGSFFPFLHYDAMAMDTQISQVYGAKEFFLYAPDQTPYMYPKEGSPEISLVGNAFEPDLNKFPLFAKTKPYRLMLNEGETLFFPKGWWHTTLIPGPSITYGRCVLNHTNWGAFLDENRKRFARTRPMLSPPAMAYGRVLGGLMSLTESLKS